MKLYTGGTFDILHRGHVKFLNACARLADEVVVALNTDDFVEKYKGSKPVIPYEDRMFMLLSLPSVDRVVENWSGQTSVPVINKVNPDIIAVGSDWAQKDYYRQMGFTQKWLDDRNIILLYLPYTEGVSSTQIKEKMSESRSNS